MSTFWFLMVIFTVMIGTFSLGFLLYTGYCDIYDYVCDELDRCKYFGE